MSVKDELRRRAEWKCPNGCGEQYWAHQLYGGYDIKTGEGTLVCPPSPQPRDCCGRLSNTSDDEIRVCSNGGCRAWWCACGTFTGMSEGTVMCGCEYDRGEVSTDPPNESSTS